MIRWIVAGIVLQTCMVVVGHWVAAVSLLFAPLGMGISLAVGLLWAREKARDYRHAAQGGAIVGGTCALVGIGVSLALGDVGAALLLFGTASSAVTGALGGLGGARLRAAGGAAS
jgi:hypothetical protein